MDLHRKILAAAERAADAGERHPDLLLGQAEHGRHLPQVVVEPLGGHVQVDAAVLGRDREPGLGAEERLVLHAEDIVAGDDHVRAPGGRAGVAAPNRLPVHDVGVRDVPAVLVLAALVHQHRAGAGGGRLVGDDGQLLIRDADLGGGPAGGLRVVGGDQRDRLAVVAHLAVGEDGGVLDLQAVGAYGGGQVVVGEHGAHPGDGQRLGGVDRHDPGVREGAAQGVAPQHVLVPQVGGVRELAGHLEDAVRAGGGLADAAAGGRVLGQSGGKAAGDAGCRYGHGHISRPVRAAARRTASRIFS